MKRSPMPARKTPLKRTPMKSTHRPSMPTLDGPRPKPKRHKNVEPAFLAARARSLGISGGCCTMCGKQASHGHHRKRRSQGGPNTAENILPLCFVCHGKVHSSGSTLAFRMGVLLRSTDEIGPWWELPFWTDRKAA
jgi:5-methylcytosine-specific restriction endonuclease McrA